MGQAFDSRGHAIGEGVYGETKREVFEKLNNLHPDAHEIRIKSLKEKFEAEEALLMSAVCAPQTEMPKYRSHKEVWALKIRAIAFDEDAAQVEGRETDGSAIITPDDAGYGAFPVDAAYVRKHSPVAGGYYVVYKDGYRSFSPAGAFEDGYARI